ncbi:DNA polymerase [Yoonia sp.]|uniref:DNA polymerase n=1 Tax=Yoonia sp. TaxID=2212373 RepID=UPI00358FE80C
MQFDKKRFRPPSRSNSSADAYLIIGFDTEYQKEAVTNGHGEVELRNRVLSYQYFCQIIDRNSESGQPSWSGIIFPEGPEDKHRFSIDTFVKTAIADGLQSIPDAILPSDVYLVAHFTRADVPGFSDFKDNDGRSAMNLENVRNLFMNVRKPVKINLAIGRGSKPLTLKVKIRDTVALAPAGATSLAKLGDILNFKKLTLSDDPAEELYFKKNMAEFMEAEPEKFREYAIRDAEICARYTSRIIKLNHEKTGMFRLPITLTSVGVDLIQSYWIANKVDPLEVVGKEVVEERYWSNKNKRYQTKEKLVSLKKLYWSEDFFTECYHGGRNEQFWFGPAPKGLWYDYDLTSAYPSAMSLIRIPDWSTLRPIRNTQELLDSSLMAHDLAFANVDFEFPDDVRYPVLPVRTDSGLVFPRKGNSTTHISEIMLAKELGCKIHLVEGRRIDALPLSTPSQMSKMMELRVFEGFARMCIEERRKHPKKSLDNLFWKELVNSTYGKTAQGLRERRIYDLRDAETKPLEPSKITNPVYAAFITAFCRGVLGEIMNALPTDVSIFSVTTDGFLTTASDEQMAEAGGHLTGYYLAAKSLLQGHQAMVGPPARVYEIKHIVRQPLGWRTRGQATIAPSRSKDWKETNLEPNDDEKVVLAKGGIQLDRTLTKSEQNDEIVQLFFNRKPTDTLTATLGAGIREMYEQGLDFVDKSVTKRLSMEFDWKRRPAKASDVPVAFKDGVEFEHLAFSTKAWDTADQFYRVREVWAQYNKSKFHCLKSLADYTEFAKFFEASLAASGEAGAYLATVDGPLKRLRRDLVIAHKLRKAGTHQLKPHACGRKNIFPTYKLRAKDFAEMLSEEFGVPCHKTDVDNARKNAVFKPYQVPRTGETLAVFGKIKREMFPYLEIEQFLTKKAEFNIDIGSL